MNILEMMKTDKSFAYKHSDEFLDVQKRAKIFVGSLIKLHQMKMKK